MIYTCMGLIILIMEGKRDPEKWQTGILTIPKPKPTALKRLKYGRKNPNKVLFMIHLMFRHS